MLDWTGERYLPDVDPSISGAEIHYEHLHRYAFASQYVKGKKVLDLASGEGYGTYMLSQTAQHVIGVEIDHEAVTHASSTYQKENIEFREGSILDIPIEGGKLFDVIVCFEAIEHVIEHDTLFLEIRRLLKEDGLLIISTPNKQAYSDDQHYCNPFHLKELYYSEFCTLLKQTFSNIYLFGQQIILGSSIYPTSVKATDLSSEFVIALEDHEFSFKPDAGKVPVYFIAIASNKKMDVKDIGRSYLVDQSNTAIKLLNNRINQFNSSIQSLELSVSAKVLEIAELANRLDVHSRVISEKEQELWEKERELREKEQQMGGLSARIRFQEQVISEKGQDLWEKKQELEGLNLQIQAMDRVISEKEKQVSDLSGDIQARAMEGAIKDRQIQDLAGRVGQLEQKIASIENSIVWQLTMKFHVKGVNRLLPPNTRRRKYYDLGIKGGRILVRHGPKPFFSSVSRYLSRNARKKQEILRSRHSKYYSGEVFTIDPSEFLPLKDMKIAVHAHVFYIDLFEEICRYLNNIPVRYTLLVSVTRSEDKKIILEKVKTLAGLEHVEVRVVENRGRDIAPFLVEFGPSLRKFDYICHIHTKKSLFTGEEKTDWRQYLFDRLLGSSDLVSAIFTVLKRDPSIGIIYPEIYPLLPYQACTWLSNKHTGRILSDKLNVRFDPDEYLDFPAGSMFWIRRESLEPILDLKLNLHDFPEELGQNDGALQHTLERCFVLAAQSRGFWYLVIRDPSTRLFSYKSHRNLAQYLGPSFESSFLQGLAAADIVSFDIFDTLLFRPFATPDMVYSYLEEIVEREFGIPRFKDLRIRAEAIARERKNFLGDVKISEIYSVFSELAGIDSNTADALLNLEVETEKKLLLPRKDLVDSAYYAKKQGKRLILVSDTYFERKNVEEMLFSKGIDCFDEIYLSSETGKRKDRGDLWEYVFEREGLTPDNFMHIGDNEESDVQRIGDKGFINKVHVMRPTALFRQSSIGARLWDGMIPFRGWRENLLFGKIANRLCSNPNQKQLIQSRHPFEDPHVFGYIVFGPIIFNFINWLIKESTRDRCELLWFVAREGYLLKDAFDLVATHPDLPDLREKLPKGRYFLCSRRTAVFAMLKTEREIPRLMEGKFRGTLRDFFTRRLCISTIAQVEARLGSGTLDLEISLPEEYDSIYEYVKRVLDILAAEAHTERELLLEYCNAEGFERSKRIGIVDMGYSGTAQSALAELLNSPIDGYYFVTETKALELARSGSRCRSCFAEYVDPYDKKLPIHRYSLLLEAILTAPTGQVIRFERDASTGIVPVFKEWGVSQHQFQQIHRIHEGILQFIAEMIEEFGPAALEIEFPKDLVQLCYKLVIEGDFDPASLRTALSVEDEYCGNDEISPLDLYREQCLKEA